VSVGKFSNLILGGPPSEQTSDHHTRRRVVWNRKRGTRRTGGFMSRRKPQESSRITPVTYCNHSRSTECKNTTGLCSSRPTTIPR
jgi:hypothetical protein